MPSLEQSNRLFESASRVLPLGVTSNFRYWCPSSTLYIDRGRGAYVWDVDDNRYIDYRLGFGPIILGHSDERVDRAVIDAIIQGGQTFGLSLPLEQRVAGQIASMVPSVEMVRFANSGTEATMHALRLARAYTGREKVVMFEGQYHGMHDQVMFTPMVRNDWMTSCRRSPVASPVCSGIPQALHELLVMLPYNDPETLQRTMRQKGHDVAAIIVEPVLGNCGGITPRSGWLETIRAVCDEYGIVLIMDEVKTGFRLARGGAQEVFGVRADLTTFAKALGNGYPVAAFGGRREIMDLIGKGVAHGGTYCGNRIGLAAASATLDILQNTPALETIAARGRALQSAIAGVLDRFGLPHVIVGHPSLFTFWLTETPPVDFRDWLRADHATYERIIQAMNRRGVLPDPDMREPWFLAESHSDEDVARTVSVLEDAVAEVLGRRPADRHIATWFRPASPSRRATAPQL